MCLAVPLRVVRVNDVLGEVEMGGVTRQVSLMLTPDAKVGDFVLVHTGFAISVIDEYEAQQTLALFTEVEAATQRADAEREGGARGKTA